jgi:hypothetical protein
MTSGVQEKRRMIVGRNLKYKTNDPRVTLERIREQQGYLLLDFSHTKYLGKETPIDQEKSELPYFLNKLRNLIISI